MHYLNTKGPYKMFWEAVNSEFYVDKSLLIGPVSRKIKRTGKYICITRPRRFGKTTNANMLAAYFTKGYDSSGLFEHLKIASSPTCERHRNQYNVIHIDFSRMPDRCTDFGQYMGDILQCLKEDLLEAYPRLQGKYYGSLSQMLCAAGDSFLFVLDEWDSIFYRSFMTDRDREDYLLFLKGLLKDQPYVDLAYMTGVLPIAKYSSGSELNMFAEFNFMNDTVYDRYFGFDEEEVRALCGQQDSLTYDELKQWYDGYHLSDGGSLFNPRSVQNALDRGVCLNYWTETGPMNEIVGCI